MTLGFALTDKSESSMDSGFGRWGPLFENSSLGVAITDSAFRFLTGNVALLQMLNCSLKELQQLSFLDICTNENRDECQLPLRELREGVRLQTRYLRKDGTSLPVRTYLSTANGTAPAQLTFLIVTVDISARLAADNALQAAQADLSRVARLTTVGAMAASIAHEISQPLASIVMNGNAGLRWLARSEPDLEEVRASLGRIVNDGHRAAQIIAGIRAMFRKESTDRSAVAVNELICDVIATSLRDLKSRQVSLTMQLSDNLPSIAADRVQLQQVISNLVTNATDSMTSVPDRHHILTVRSEGLDEWVLISVLDTGTGIAPELAERLFEAFYTTKPDGIGLGLAISRSIVESHGGRLSALPAQPHGSVFRVLLPTKR
jgi:PAS domain S-box-containing protein